MKERLVIIFVALIAGLFITSAGFFIYQSTKNVNDTPVAKKSSANEPTPVPEESTTFVRVLEPKDESLTAKRSVTVKGSTNPDNIVVISTNLEDVEAKPSTDGNFSVAIDIDAGANPIITRVIAPDGTSAEDIRTITFSTEEF